uniref:Uncharacterized protein n=1 Tax=Favella ehrenbergii TaxID=182087 RepID=A0A7S3HV49_9SPIT|mmetsp:Transcript_41375/g.54418  ORF Transcript_41375/g.54418 Transcript_41375/m.54418 type:complete len:117 (-) Transcript_41375:58-408(-)
MMDSIKGHPFLNFFMQVLGATFAVLMLCLLLTCCKYKNVSTQYQELRQRDTSTSQIVNRKDRVADEEDRPTQRRRARGGDKPDPETFGKRSPDEIEDMQRKADSEIELGELDVDFA